MSGILTPGERPTLWERLGDLARRVARLEAVPPGESGWRFNIDNEGGWAYVQFNACFDLDTLPDPLAVGGMWGAAFEDASSCGYLIGSTALMMVKGNALTLALAGVGQDFILVDWSTGQQMLKMTQGSSDLHIPAGGNVIADL